MSSITIIAIAKEARVNYLSSLLEADPNEALVREYLHHGDLFVIKRDQRIIGVSLFTFPKIRTVELKNIAIKSTIRNQGYGKAVIQQATKLYKQRGYQEMIVGVANSSIDNFNFYQKLGFRLVDIEPDFYIDYPTPLYENGIPTRDRLIFVKRI
ncbi:Acetyltransferase (GNAT) family protein [Halolactibacillus halophilus]|uniref:Acetyltransferase (GNAT) family protein n=1 Tax=Halolactibacillus halophilus TaxID=306540 RepID=A0A1I5RDM3_9BACI|nr:GNAT family N-acetyltransferase [Halolactibacillus halophilus]GEM02179.1 N-acetyltransferase [Halolactibacillus halophilus]SFP56629.1 Acetyltransferase (GNAT) family protein [Halolactibacillus halophilus]